jgi:hypothetical protein
MHYLVASKEPLDTSWPWPPPAGWPWPPWGWPPEPWPPTDIGPPVDITSWPPTMPISTVGYSLSASGPETINIGSAATITSDILDEYDENTDAFEYHLVVVSATIDGEAVQLKKTAGDDYSDLIVYQVTNYEGAKYGFSESIYFDIGSEAAGETLSVRCALYTARPELTDAVEVEVRETLSLVITEYPSRALHFSEYNFRVEVRDGSGTVVDGASPPCTISVSSTYYGPVDLEDYIEPSVSSIDEEDWLAGVYETAEMSFTIKDAYRRPTEEDGWTEVGRALYRYLRITVASEGLASGVADITLGGIAEKSTEIETSADSHDFLISDHRQKSIVARDGSFIVMKSNGFYDELDTSAIFTKADRDGELLVENVIDFGDDHVYSKGRWNIDYPMAITEDHLYVLSKSCFRKLRLSDLEVVAAIGTDELIAGVDGSFQATGYQNIAISEDGSYAYILFHRGSSYLVDGKGAHIVRIDLSSMSASLGDPFLVGYYKPIYAVEGAYPIAIDADYVFTRVYSFFYKVSRTTLNLVQYASNRNAGENWSIMDGDYSTGGLVSRGDYLYVFTAVGPVRVKKTDLSVCGEDAPTDDRLGAVGVARRLWIVGDKLFAVRHGVIDVFDAGTLEIITEYQCADDEIRTDYTSGRYTSESFADDGEMVATYSNRYVSLTGY